MCAGFFVIDSWLIHIGSELVHAIFGTESQHVILPMQGPRPHFV